MERAEIQLLPTERRAQRAILGLSACGGISALSAAVSAWVVMAMPEARSRAGHADFEAEVGYLEAVIDGISVAGVVAFVATAVYFCMWLYRAYRNMRVVARPLPVGGRETAFTPAGAVWGFFIPIVNLWRPYHAVSEMWDRSTPGDDASANPTMVQVWWGTWLLAGFLARAAHKLASRAGDDMDLMQVAVGASLFAQVVRVVAAALAILVIRGVEARLAARVDWLASVVPGHVSPS